MTEIVLSVKRIIAKLHCQGVKTVYLDAVGPCEVNAGDIKADGEVEILNPDLHICTLGPEATFNMEITMSHGRGYVSADRNKTPQTVIGVIPIDSIYTPVYKVNYTVENTRVGNMTDYDKLTLGVWTDSTISARDAVSLGAKILSDHLSLFTNLSETVANASTVVEKPESSTNKVLQMTIDELDLSVRSFNCLKRANINTVEDLISKTGEDMMKVRNMGKKSLDAVSYTHLVRGKISGTPGRPRLNVYRSNANIYAQLIDDVNGTTLVSASTLDKGFEGAAGNCEAAKRVGLALAQRAKEKGISAVVFDRSGYVYHGRVAALAEGAREGGLEF